jgi:hypothetical protein
MDSDINVEYKKIFIWFSVQGTYGSPNPSLSGHVKYKSYFVTSTKGGVRGTVGSLK